MAAKVHNKYTVARHNRTNFEYLKNIPFLHVYLLIYNTLHSEKSAIQLKNMHVLRYFVFVFFIAGCIKYTYIKLP